jgi:NADPH:quinone reductase-like Zn-dependent oxidoreductase
MTTPQSGKSLVYDKNGQDYFAWNPSFATPKVGKGEVLLKVISAGLNPVDYKLPHIPPMYMAQKGKPVGQDVCGVILEYGKDVSGFAVGDKVFGFGGGCTEYTVTEAKKLTKVPENAKNVEIYGGIGVAAITAYQMLKLTDSFDGSECKKILIIGASGGVGSCAIQIAKALCPSGSKIIGICSDKSSDFVRSLGADEIINYSKAEFKFGSCVETKSLDVIIDCVSSPEDYNYVPEGMGLIKEKTGRYIAANSASKMDWAKLFISSATGFKLFRGQYQLMFLKHSADDLTVIGNLVNEGKLKIKVQEYVPFEEEAIRKAFKTLAGRRVHGKLIVKM